MIDDDIRTALLPVFAPLEVVHANENGPRPAGKYVTMRIERTHELPAHVGTIDEPPPIPAFGERDLAAHRTGLVELQAFGVGSYDDMDAAMLKLESLAAIDAADAAGVVFGTVSDIQNVPALRNETTWEARAVCSLPFAYTREVTEAVPVIETVEGEVIIEGFPPMPFEASIVDN